MKKISLKQIFTLLLCNLFILVNIVGCANQEAETTKSETTSKSEIVTEVVTEKESETEAVKTEETKAEETQAEEIGETRIFIDSTGREIEVPNQIDKVALSGPLAQIVLYAFSPELLVGFSTDWSEEVEAYIPEEYLALPTIGQLYGGKGELNLEELLSSGAQIVIDVGEPKKTIIEDMDGLQEQTGLPFVHITLTLAEPEEAYAKLGELLNLEERGQEFADYCSNVYEKANAISNEVEKKNLLYVAGENGLNVIAKDSFHAEVIDLLSNNLAVVDEPSSQGMGNEVDMEQILNWNPDVIIFAPDSIYDTVQDLPEWQSITAIQNGDYYEVPFGPYNWLGFPPSVQRYLGLLWMADLLYPDAVDYNIEEEVQQYFEMFYHTELSEEQYQKLIENSIGND